MLSFNYKLNKKYALDINMLYKHRWFDDGITFLEFKIGYDKYEADHKPSFIIWFCFCNYCIFSLEIYNMFHINDTASVE